MSNEAYGRYPISQSRNPFTCGITGKTYTTNEAFERRELLARALSKIMGWTPNDLTPWEKVVGVFSFNNVSVISSAVYSENTLRSKRGAAGR